MDLQGRVALVTGGTRGIGAAAALALARGGADVALAARHRDAQAVALETEIRGLGRQALLIEADLGLANDATRCVEETIATLGGVDVLVHAAGANVPGGLLDVTPDQWRQAFDVHVHAVYHLCRAAMPQMRLKREGAIVLISSVAGIRGVAMNLAYQVVKGALPQMARALAREFADDNIRVNCVAPGIIRTRFHEKMTPQQQQHNLEHRVPLHREGTPEQVAEAIVMLATNDYITGETLVVDGGLTMRIA